MVSNLYTPNLPRIKPLSPLSAGHNFANHRAMKTLLLCLMLGLSLSSRAQDLNLEENKYLGYIYQQQEYQINDPKGDVLLLWAAHQIPKFIMSNLKGKTPEIVKFRQQKIDELLLKYPQYALKEETKNLVNESYVPFNPAHVAIELEGHKAPFRVRKMVTMMKQVISEEFQLHGLKPQIGTVHEWSPEIKKELRNKFKLFSRMSKLLVALSRGGTSYYMVTGTEEKLKDYILTRPENSITLEEMFRASYKINQGDVYLTLLTVENLLSRFWMAPHRSQRLVTTKLKDITNFNYHTDKFGSWYHLFGIMLYGYAEGSFKAKVVGNLETLGSHIMGRLTDEKQEDYINGRGGVVGGRLGKFIRSNEYETFKIDKKYLEEDFYMDLDEDFTKRIEKAKEKHLK
jgi:hypothetical protein